MEIGNEELGLVHLLKHWEKEFSGWSVNDVFELIDLIADTIAKKDGRIILKGEIIYELDFYDAEGERQYLGIVYGEDNNIITAYKYTQYDDAELLFLTTNYIGEI